MGRHLARALALLLALGLAGLARADYVRDEIRVNMRTGPGTQYRITKVLTSGDRVTPLGASNNWVKVRTVEGEEGWVPDGYTSPEIPASLALPETHAKLVRAQSQIEAFESQLPEHESALAELGRLRERVERLSTENTRLGVSTRWKDYLVGAGLLALGVLLGMAVPRGSVARARKIKL